MRGAELERLDQRREAVRVFSETEIGGGGPGTGPAPPRRAPKPPAASFPSPARPHSRPRLSGRRSRAELNKPRHLRCSRAPETRVRVPGCQAPDSADEPVMNGKIETPAFACVSVAGLYAGFFVPPIASFAVLAQPCGWVTASHSAACLSLLYPC